MANNTQTYTTRIFLNAEEAKKQLDELQQKVVRLRKEKEDAATKGDWPTFNRLKKELDKANNDIRTMQTSAQKVDRVLGKLSAAGIKDIRQTIEAINKELSSGAIERGSEEWKFLNEQLKRCKAELKAIRNEGTEGMPVWQKFMKFLNDSWGGIFVLVQSVSGISTTIRQSVQDYADMEEEMADVRKYTGMAAEQVREMNEDLKKMDTRTSREELNKLAGSAGRLGLQSKKDIMEFIEAADKIGVALGDDLGDGAVDKIGKLAMAFGEDDKKGLKGAMLATGSALNELAQNSSAQAGYLVEFTARVAGFGKQLGLTQAQIMGFGTVMDENLLKDEMAATAFGNMLTKMQTDTEKFAKIAGMSVEKFSKLLHDDANSAILALADSLKKADPQNMMKMLDDMGLDGSRAVGVLSTMADKIDDVRKHQQRATEAYEKATSVEGEFNTMNTTVQAEIDKCKKRFHEMSVELGERLLPVVKYTITGASLLAKTLSVLTGFVYDHWKSIAVLTGYVAALTVVWNLHTIAVKASNAAQAVSLALHKGLQAAVTAYRQVALLLSMALSLATNNQNRLNAAMVVAKRLQMTNIFAAAATVILTLGVAIYGAVKAWNKHTEAIKNNLQQVKEMRAQQQLQQGLNKKVNESIAEQKTKVEQLSRVIHSNAYTVDERRKAIKTLQSIIPDYHASIKKEGELYEENYTAIKDYIQGLKDAALAEAIYAKKVEINKKKLDLAYKEDRIKGSLKAVQAYRETQQQTETVETVDENGRPLEYQTKTASAIESDRQQKIHEERLKNVKSEQKVVEAEDKYLDKVLEKNKKVNELFSKKVTNTPTTSTVTNDTKSTKPYVSDAEKKKQEEAAKKAETERKEKLKKQADEAKASYNEQLAEEMLAYRQGITTYSDYLEEKHNITQNYYDRLKAIYGEDSVEYRKQLLNREKDEDDYNKRQNKMSERGFLMEKYKRELELQKDFNDQNNREMFQNEEAMNEALFRSDRQYMLDKRSLYKEGSKEWEEAATEIQMMEKEHQMELEQDWMRRLSQYRQEMGKMDYDRLQQIEIAGVQSFYGALVKQGKMTQTEVDAIIEHIKKKYAELKGQQTVGNDIQAKASSALEIAMKNANAKDYGAGDNAATGIFSIANAIKNQQTVNEKLKELYGEDYENNKEYQEAKRQLDDNTMTGIIAGAQAAYNTINSFMNAASSYAQACSALETAQITKDYEKQIAAAGKNSRKREKLEKERDKKIAKAKSAANKKAMNIEIAQALAGTALAAINAYASASKISWILGPIAAAMATAAGMLQIATIKKQHEAEAAGYYEGGYTGGKRYRREAGVVHEGEFVANHQAVNNPNIRPMLDFLDQAQRNNTVGSLTQGDVQRQLATGQPVVVQPNINVSPDNSTLEPVLGGVQEGIERLNQELDKGLKVQFVMDEFDKENRHYQKMKNR